MDPPPLTLTLLRLSPYTLFPPSSSSEQPSSLLISSTPLPTPAPPGAFHLSPTHNYSPTGLMSLGSTLACHVQLSNTRSDRGGVRGVRMMCEVQGPGGRWRLGEVVHGEEMRDGGGPGGGIEGEEKAGVGEGGGEGGGGSGEGLEGGNNGTAVDSGEEEDGRGAGQGQGEEGEEGKSPELEWSEHVSLDVGMEIKEVGAHILILSVAWETPDGRRTLQRFIKFDVDPPLAIKTRIQLPSHPNNQLDPTRREEISLEVLMQNTSTEGLLFEKIVLEPVQGMFSRAVSSPSSSTAVNPGSAGVFEGDLATFLPGDTRQYLFLLVPSSSPRDNGDSVPPTPSLAFGPETPNDLPKSVFPPAHSAGTILPLGRLDVSWASGPYHAPGRLQTSTLNRRAPVTGIQPRPIAPTTTSTAVAHSPAVMARTASSSTRDSQGPVVPHKEERDWEFDLVVLSLERDGVGVEAEFTMTLRVGVRSSWPASADDEPMPGPVRLGVQYLSRAPTPPSVPPNPAAATPRSYTTQSTATATTPLHGPFSPLSPTAPARPLTPVSTQLRQATSTQLLSPSTQGSQNPQSPISPPRTSFPPPPHLPATPPTSSAATSTLTRRKPPWTIGGMAIGEIVHLGPSLVLLPPTELKRVYDNPGITYSDPPPAPVKLWEGTGETTLRFLAVEEGLAELGGFRVLLLDDESGMRGSVGREWECLGDVWVAG